MTSTKGGGDTRDCCVLPASSPTVERGTINFQPSSSLRAIVEECVDGLADPTKCAVSLRTLRNKLLGHEALKKFIVMEFGLVEKLVPFLTFGVSTDLQKEAVVILGSIAYGGTEEINVILKNGIPQRLLLEMICKFSLPSVETKLIESVIRTLRTIYRQASTPRDIPFNQQILPRLAKLLEDSNEKTREYTAVMLANCCDSKEKQTLLRDIGAIGISLKMATTRSHPFSGLEAALDLLASITRDNQENSKALATFNQDGINPVAFLFDLLTRRLNPEIKIFTSICLTNLFRAGLLNSHHQTGNDVDARVIKLLIPCLISLLADGIPVRARAAEVLALLLSDSERLQVVACDADVISKLVSMLTNPNASDGEKKAALLALAAISSFKEECRRMVIDTKILPVIIQAIENPCEGIRAAACQCTRSLSRSVKNLRTALVDAGMIKPLMHLLYDRSLIVQKTACAALCNLVLDFSPMKEIVLKDGGVARLVELTMAADAELRFNALWALKNLLYLAETPIKIATLDKLTFERLEQLANDADNAVQEQTLNLLRNLVCEKEQDISEVLARLGEARLIKLIEKKIISDRDDIVMHSCYVIANACTASTLATKDAVMVSTKVLDKLLSLLHIGQRADLQVAALWCVINLTWTDDVGSSDRISVLKRKGMEKQLEILASSPNVGADVRDRVQTALNNFNALRSSAPTTTTTTSNTRRS